MTITEEHLECTCRPDCPWIGLELEAVRIDTDHGSEYRCPLCGEWAAHFPLDEVAS